MRLGTLAIAMESNAVLSKEVLEPSNLAVAGLELFADLFELWAKGLDLDFEIFDVLLLAFAVSALSLAIELLSSCLGRLAVRLRATPLGRLTVGWEGSTVRLDRGGFKIRLLTSELFLAGQVAIEAHVQRTWTATRSGGRCQALLLLIEIHDCCRHGIGRERASRSWTCAASLSKTRAPGERKDGKYF